MKKILFISALVGAFVWSTSSIIAKAILQNAPSNFTKEMSGTVVSVDNFRRKVSDSSAWNTGAMIEMEDGSMKLAYLKQGVNVKQGDCVTVIWETITYTSNGERSHYEGWMVK